MNELLLLASLLFSETKNLDDARGIANVVLNRMKKPEKFGNNLNEVIFAPSQFSGVGSDEWNKVVNNKLTKDDEKIFKEMILISSQALKGQLKDNTGGADHYVNLKKSQPSWSKVYKKTGQIDNHTYFLEVPEKPKRKYSKPLSFNETFKQAVDQGLKEFEWRGKKYTTEVKYP